MNENSQRLLALEAENQELQVRVQALSTPNDVLPGFIRASNPAMNAKHLLPAAIHNSGGQPQVVREHADIGNGGALDGRMPQAAVPVSNAAGGLHGGTTAPCLQIPPLAVDGTTLRSPLVCETLVTSSTSTPLEVEPVNPNPRTSNPDVARRFAEMEALIQCILGMPAPIKKSAINSFVDSPFVDAIALVEMPRKFNFPNMKPYDGTTDSDDHIAQYILSMFTIAIPRDLREACMYKGFRLSLVGPALQ
ncbi:hypothetical protein ACOSP7_014833 [Xanthoceras sorbifolium]